MLISDIQAELDRLAPMITAKGIPAPNLSFRIEANAPTFVYLTWYDKPPYGGEFHSKAFNTFADLAAWIDALPTPEVKALRDHNDRIAKVIDAAREDGIPDEYVTPLVTVREALSSNLLTVA